jgi:extracellular elastinolytic metalloproteinase
MKLQPCYSPFFDMRDTILQLGQVPTCGEKFCNIWEGFAEGVQGVDASVKGRTPRGGGVREDVSLFLHLSFFWCHRC